MAHVFVVSESPKHNIAPALDYGEIVVVLPPNLSQVIFSSGPTVQPMIIFYLSGTPQQLPSWRVLPPPKIQADIRRSNGTNRSGAICQFK